MDREDGFYTSVIPRSYLRADVSSDIRKIKSQTQILPIVTSHTKELTDGKWSHVLARLFPKSLLS